MIAHVFYRRGIIEAWGRGTLKIARLMREAGHESPTVTIRAGAVVVTFNFTPEAPRKYPGSTQEVGSRVVAEVEKVVRALTSELTRQALQQAIGLKDSEHFRKAYLLPALESGLVEMTQPDKPRSSKQRYRLTQKGRQWLGERDDNREGRGE